MNENQLQEILSSTVDYYDSLFIEYLQALGLPADGMEARYLNNYLVGLITTKLQKRTDEDIRERSGTFYLPGKI